MQQKHMMPLSAVRSGEKVRLAGIEAGRGLNSRLIAMGLVPNVEITVVSNNHPGPFVIMVKRSKVVLGRGMAQKIMVNACEYEEDKRRVSGQS
jgi:Fe2+ transport system protein FeoA